jgi:hypothetical protein
MAPGPAPSGLSGAVKPGAPYGFSRNPVTPSTDPAGAGRPAGSKVPLQLFGGQQRVELAADTARGRNTTLSAPEDEIGPPG